jgi:hypothetical protein
MRSTVRANAFVDDSCRFGHISPVQLHGQPLTPAARGIMTDVLFELHRSLVLLRNRARDFRRSPDTRGAKIRVGQKER